MNEVPAAPTDWPAIILAIGTLIGSITAAGLSIFSAIMSARAVNSSKANNVEIVKLHAQVNSNQDKLVQIVDAAGVAKGIIRESDRRDAQEAGREQGRMEALKDALGTPSDAKPIKEALGGAATEATLAEVRDRLPPKQT